MFMLNKQTMKKDAKRQDAYSYLRIQTAAYLINQLRETLVENGCGIRSESEGYPRIFRRTYLRM